MQDWFIHNFGLKIIDFALWEMNKAVLREHSPVLIDPLYNDRERRELIFKIIQPGDVANMGYSPHRYRIGVRISLLAELYYNMHEEVIQRAYYDHIPGFKRLNNEIINLKNENKTEITKRTEKLNNEVEALKEALKTNITNKNNEINHLKEIIKNDNSYYKNEINKLTLETHNLNSNFLKLTSFKKWLKYKVLKHL